MHLAFIDDTKQTGKRKGLGKLLGLGSICFGEDHLKPFADDFHAVLDAHSVPHDVEMKWSSDGKTDWFRLNGKQGELTQIRRELLKCAADHEARVHAAVWDQTAAPTFRGDEPEKWLITFLFERVSMALENDGHLGELIFDKPGGDHKTEDKWIGSTLDLTALGTEYVDRRAVVLPILTAPSHHHPHLQMADLVAGATTAAVAGSRFGLNLIPDLKPLFHTNGAGNIGSAGLKLWPPTLNNLHFWLWGEPNLGLRPSTALPAPLWSFAHDPGLAARGRQPPGVRRHPVETGCPAANRLRSDNQANQSALRSRGGRRPGGPCRRRRPHSPPRCRTSGPTRRGSWRRGQVSAANAPRRTRSGTSSLRCSASPAVGWEQCSSSLRASLGYP